ncbi:hypothetical protein LSH36_449g04011 [Paralvinella palmiformis]|uniref:Prokaryotic-type class I peptide chain release factors domain-containing protein n=1 Tax=Paralvinella palmiformis TaxID=53620 RepID=A0AAD9JAH9_9ANNE|nr:hypothetical protein LSH36_449g04011 [Paralvinella palmiformis]
MDIETSSTRTLWEHYTYPKIITEIYTTASALKQRGIQDLLPPELHIFMMFIRTLGKWPTSGGRILSVMERCLCSAMYSQQCSPYGIGGIHHNTYRSSSKCHVVIKSHQHLTAPYTSIQRWYSSNSLTELSFRDEQVQAHVNSLLQRLIRLQTEVVSGRFNSDTERQNVISEITKLKPIVAAIENYQKIEQELIELKHIGEDMSEKDKKELEAMTVNDIERLSYELEIQSEEILNLLVPAEAVDSSDIILEVSAGIGGAEAFLFTKEIFDMYLNYITYKGWNYEIIDADYADNVAGGLRKASVSISGLDVYRHLKYESGVHRVQRVPKTEKQGRIHTSTVTVAILPQPREIDIKINPKDLKIDTFRSSGAGGQHVNTTDSAVRIKHIPTGIVAECQTQRSQIQNRSTAMKVLISRIYEREIEAQMAKQTATRKVQVGSAGRSEKIRTFNFKQDRVTDHRLSENMYNINEFLAGGDMLSEMISSLHLLARNEQLLELVTKTTKKK